MKIYIVISGEFDGGLPSVEGVYQHAGKAATRAEQIAKNRNLKKESTSSHRSMTEILQAEPDGEWRHLWADPSDFVGVVEVEAVS